MNTTSTSSLDASDTPLDTPTTGTQARRKGGWSADMSQRIRTIAVGLPIILLVVFAGKPFVELGIFIVGAVVAVEIAHMIQPKSRWVMWAAVFATVLIMMGVAMEIYWLIVLPISVILALGVGAAFKAPVDRFKQFRNPYMYIAMGTLYLGVPLAMLPLIRNNEGGLAWIIYLFFTTWTTDTLALLGGRKWGKNKLAPSISPAKTIEGALVGYLCGAAMALVVALAGTLPAVPALLGMVILPFLVICGDLVESWAKRSFAVKDSGSLLPGHGGFFDRVDGLILATPALYFILLLAGIIA